MFAFPFDREETEHFVLEDGAANGTSKLLTAVIWVLGVLATFAVGNFLVGIQCRVAKVAEDRTMIVVRAGLSDHVDGRALGTAILRRKTLRADLEFLNRFQGKLHHRSANGVVLVVDPVDCDVHVATVGSVNRKNGITVLGGVIGIRGFHAWRKIG